jgi:hypothetical protein
MRTRALVSILFLVCVALVALLGSPLSSETSAQRQTLLAPDQTKPAAQLVENAKRAGRDFSAVALFDPQTRSVVADVARRRAVKAGTVLKLRPNALLDVVNKNSETLTLRVPTFGGSPVELELVKVNLLAPNFFVATSRSQGAPVAYNRGVHYWGTIKGIENSLATISVFKNEVIGSYSSPVRGNFVIGKLGGNNPQRDHIVYAENDLTSEIPVSCAMPDDDTPFSPEQVSDSALATQAANQCVKIYLEADFDLFQNKGSVTETVNYLTGVFNQSAALYNNEGLSISLSEIFVWTSPSPYNGTSSGQQLAQFQSVRTSFNGDIAHLVDLENQGGVAAGFNGFCNTNAAQRQSYSGIFPFYSEVPTYSWTVYVFTHEIGHLFGSRHTHACVWNGNGTPIDGCGPAAGFTEGCSGPIPGDGGTIMSYCHLNSVGVNFAQGFGSQPGNVIRNAFNDASCLGACGDPGNGTYTTAFRTVGGHYFVAEGAGGDVLNANRTAIGSWETFTLLDLNGGSLESGDLVNIRSVGGYYMVAEGGGDDVVNCNRTEPFSWETFRIQKVSGGGTTVGTIGSGDAISLQAANGWSGGGGNYVVAEDGGGGAVNANRSAVASWETFTILIF